VQQHKQSKTSTPPDDHFATALGEGKAKKVDKNFELARSCGVRSPTVGGPISAGNCIDEVTQSKPALSICPLFKRRAEGIRIDATGSGPLVAQFSICRLYVARLSAGLASMKIFYVRNGRANVSSQLQQICAAASAFARVRTLIFR
jgi:hypothetical protein